VDEGAVQLPHDGDLQPVPVRADDHAVDAAISLLSGAERPLVLGSPSAWRGQAGVRLRAFLDTAGLPGFIIESPRGLTDPALHGVGSAFKRADVVLLLAPQDFTIGFAGEGALGTARLIQVAPSSSEVGRNRPADVALVGDALTVLDQLLTAARARIWTASGWRGELEAEQQAGLARLAQHERADVTPIHPLRLATAVREFLDDGDSVALDGGEVGQWARWSIGSELYTTILNGKFGGIGPAIPFAIAAKVARPARRCVAFLGDGTFGFHGLELDTAVRFDLPIVVVVGNDAGWAAERHRQRAVYGADRLVAADLLPTRYDKVAEALGCHGEYVERPGQLRPALERAFSSGKPACVNVAIASIPSPSATQ